MNTQYGTPIRTRVKYAFRCAGCGSTGVLYIPKDQRGQVGCPDECGSTYIQWTHPNGKYALTCVVLAVSDRRSTDESA